MINIIKELYKLNRCLISSDQDKALLWIIKQVDPKHSKLWEIPSGEEVFTWTVPQKWQLISGKLIDFTDSKLIFTHTDNPLHVMTGSLPYEGEITFEELEKHLHFRKDYPRAIPYVMRYYQNKDWGLCLSYEQYLKLNKNHKYKVVIESSWTDGHLKVLEVTIRGKTADELHILAHVDHPFQANDNLSGVAVALQLYQDLRTVKINHTLKFIFHSETIGTIAYLFSRQKDFSRIKGAIVLDIVGNKNSFLFQKSFTEKSPLDYATKYVFKEKLKKFRVAKFQEIMGSEEYTYNDPKIAIPAILISTFPYKEYHTHFDSPDIVSEKQLKMANIILKEILKLLDLDFIPQRNYYGPLQRGPIGWFFEDSKLNTLLDMFQYNMNGVKTVIQIAGEIGLDLEIALRFSQDLLQRKLIHGKN